MEGRRVTEEVVTGKEGKGRQQEKQEGYRDRGEQKKDKYEEMGEERWRERWKRGSK